MNLKKNHLELQNLLTVQRHRKVNIIVHFECVKNQRDFFTWLKFTFLAYGLVMSGLLTSSNDKMLIRSKEEDELGEPTGISLSWEFLDQ